MSRGTMDSGYFVHGVQLVGVDERCEACGQRKAVGRSVSGLAICARCARDYADAASALALEVQR